MTKRLQPFLSLVWKAGKLYANYLNAAASGYDLTRNEKDVLLFLYNNAPLDTAADIVKHRNISKSLVAKSVASLSERGFLLQQPDTADARFVHLAIVPSAMPAVLELREAQDRFFAIFEGSLPEQERRQFMEMLARVEEHLEAYL